MAYLRRNQLARNILLALYVLAAATFGFAHRSTAVATSPDLSSYALPDGSLPFICGQPGKAGDPSGKHVCTPCDACLLSSAPGLASEHVSLLSLPSTMVEVEPPEGRLARPVVEKPLSFRSRAPPYSRA